MKMHNNLICIIPIRSGSQTIKNKNIINIKKKPLIYYTLNKAIKSRIFKYIIISTDSQYYINKIKKLKIDKKNIIFHLRSKKNSTSVSSTESVIQEVLEYYKEIFSNKTTINLIQATSPLIHSSDLIKANKKFVAQNFDSLFSCYLTKNFFWKKKKKLISLNYNYKNRPRRQEMKEEYFTENGAFYIFKFKGFIKHKNRLFDKIGFFKMSKYRSFEIDDYEDLNLIKSII